MEEKKKKKKKEEEKVTPHVCVHMENERKERKNKNPPRIKQN